MRLPVHGRQIAAVAAAAAIFTAAPAADALAAPAEQPEYWKAATYYSDDWVVNFWNSESVHMEEELAQIRADGFNSIILAVPWKEFQPMNGPGQLGYEEYAYEKLNRVFETAQRQGLWVFLRVGYTWDYGGGSMTSSRHEALLYDENMRQAWLAYVESLYQASSVHSNFAGGFLTWEDFWNFLQNTGNGRYGQQSLQLAEAIGYQDFLRENYTLEELEQQFGLSASSFGEIGLPDSEDPMFYTFYQFYDQVLNRILEESQEVFPGLSMEVRLDMDPVPSADGGLVGASHGATYECGSAAYTAAMYSVSMGREAADGDMTAAEALTAMAANLASVLAQNGGKPLFLEQFLYYDDTPEYSYNPKLLPGERTAFLKGASPLLTAMTGGYGVWTYRDYRNNSVFNSQFGLETAGWTFSGGAAVQEEDGNKRAYLPAGGQISQDLGTRSRQGRSGDRTLEFLAEGEGAAVTVSVGSQTYSVTVDGLETVTLSFPQEGDLLTISSDGPVTVDNVCFYNLETEGLLYHADGSEGELIQAVRELNESLP